MRGNCVRFRVWGGHLPLLQDTNSYSDHASRSPPSAGARENASQDVRPSLFSLFPNRQTFAHMNYTGSGVPR